ncbi:MAG TPA: YlxR family protein [Firmicutes bacterium]|nr:YlxR family protein [Bacillota bacterium]
MPKGQAQPKKRKIPMRTCLGCQEVKPKKELIRIVRTSGGEFKVDPSGKLAGRGAYLCPNEACINSALSSKRFQKALGDDLSPEVVSQLKMELARREAERREIERRKALLESQSGKK